MMRDLFAPPAEVRPALDLATLAAQINAAHEQAGTALRAGLLHAKAAGELLLRAKEQLPHGRWLPWLQANVRCSQRTAQSYMRVAKRWDELQANPQGLADLTFEGGLKLLACPRREGRAGAWDDLAMWTEALAEKGEEARRILAEVVPIVHKPDATFSELLEAQRTLAELHNDLGELLVRSQRTAGFLLSLDDLNHAFRYRGVNSRGEMMELTPNPEVKDGWFGGVHRGLDTDKPWVDYLTATVVLEPSTVDDLCKAMKFTADCGWVDEPFDGQKPSYLTDTCPMEDPRP
jgi:hypothetical protein